MGFLYFFSLIADVIMLFIFLFNTIVELHAMDNNNNNNNFSLKNECGLYM